MFITSFVRRFVSFTALALVALPVVACAVGEDPTTEETESDQAPLTTIAVKTPPRPPSDDLVVVGSSSGGTSKGIFCILCEAQGCVCNGAGDACVECGYHFTASQGREP